MTSFALEVTDLLTPDEWSDAILEDLDRFDSGTRQANEPAIIETVRIPLSPPSTTTMQRFIAHRHDSLLRSIRAEVSHHRYETILMTLSFYGNGVLSEAVAEVFIRNALSSHQALHDEFCLMMHEKRIYDIVHRSYNAVASIQRSK